MQNDKAMKTYYLATLGCPKNEVDSEAIETDLMAAGLQPSADAGAADLLIVNSCGFIADAKIESINSILSLHQERKKDSILVLCGCLPARYNLGKSLDEVDIFLPWDKHSQLVPRLQEFGWSVKKSAAKNKRLMPSAGFGYLKISEGCDNRCAYCAIPDIKGPFKSRPANEIIDEAQFLCSNGVKELILIGQDTTHYGQDASEQGSLSSLINDLAAIDGCHWIRIMYAHPAHLDDETIKTIAQIPKVVKYLDLPLQHANSRLLELMRRKVDRTYIESLIKKLRVQIPGIVLRTTFIVGFPGETDGEFSELLDFCEATHFDNVGIFKYSPEEGTPAYSFEAHVDEKIIEERYLTILDMQNIISEGNLKKRINHQERVLIDRIEPNGTGYGHGWFQAPEVDGQIIINQCDTIPGQFMEVLIERSDAYDLFARPSGAGPLMGQLQRG
jgi:ribosomal protein S12 methylthiotransferase